MDNHIQQYLELSNQLNGLMVLNIKAMLLDIFFQLVLYSNNSPLIQAKEVKTTLTSTLNSLIRASTKQDQVLEALTNMINLESGWTMIQRTKVQFYQKMIVTPLEMLLEIFMEGLKLTESRYLVWVVKGLLIDNSNIDKKDKRSINILILRLERMRKVDKKQFFNSFD